MFKFNLGDKVTDIIAGFSGVIVSRTEWYNGCIRYTVQSTKLLANKSESEAFDEEQLKLSGKPILPIRKKNAPRTGGPHPMPSLPKVSR